MCYNSIIKKVEKGSQTRKEQNMFKLSYSIEYNTNPNYPLSKEFGTCLGVIVNNEIEANEMLDLLSIRGTILETNLVELVDYKPSNRVVYATTRSWE
jgi:hypothetical protein